MLFGTITIACKVPLEEKLDRIQALGMDVWQPSFPEVAGEDPERIKDLVAARGLTMSALGAGVPMCNPAKRDDNLKDWQARVAASAAIGVPYVISRTFPKPNGVSDEEAWKVCIDVGKEMVKRAAGVGCAYALETDSGNFVHSLETTRQLLDGIGMDEMKINYDPCNFYVGGGDDPLEVIEVLYDHIVHGHIKDGVRPEGDKPHEVPVGAGDVDYVKVFAELRRRGFQGAMAIEHLKTFEDIEAAWDHVQQCRARLG